MKKERKKIKKKKLRKTERNVKFTKNYKERKKINK